MARPAARAGASLVRLCESLQRTADDERRRTARVLHDTAVQTMSAAAMSLSLVEAQADALTPEGRRALAEAQALAATCCRELRDISAALFPPLLAEAGLGPALRALATRHAPRAQLVLAPLPRYAAAVELAAYRSIEEALTSVFDEAAPVQGKVAPDARGGLTVTLAGRPLAGGNAALARLALRERGRGVGARVQLRKNHTQLLLSARFPPA
jgi:signal transduction histidine kinase